MKPTALVVGLLAGFATSVRADPATYSCTSHEHSRPTYLQLDEKARVVRMGRSATSLDVVEPAIFGKQSVTWAHPVGTISWSYTFDQATGVLTWGPPRSPSQDRCKKI